MLKTIGAYTLLVFGLLANAASLAGMWLSYASAPADTQVRFVRFLWMLGGIGSAAIYLIVAAILFTYLRKPKEQPAESVASMAALQAAEHRISRLENELAQERARKDAELPASRAKLIPIRLGRTPNNRFGLFTRNDGEPAFDISIEEPVRLGTSKLQFWNRTYPGLTKEAGELFIEANIEVSTGYALTAGALRDQMIKADLEAITLKIRYRDLENKWVTTFEVIREFWEHGLRIGGIRQERA